jgi:mannose-1-phosphate guanylyltransferase
MRQKRFNEGCSIMKSRRITPIILSGGSGTRLWPMSVVERPKQFLPLTAVETMFQLTLGRAADAERFAPPIIVANARHADLIEEQLAGRSFGAMILEPCARNTAPAIALAALDAGDAPLLVMPSDHVIANEAAFSEALERALPLAEEGWLVTFGIAPDAPETGYGYIKVGEALASGVHKVERFIEKPDRASAEAMLAAGGHSWNGGIFLFRADAFLAALETYAPAILTAARKAMATAQRAGKRILPDEEAFAGCPSNSIDYAVMERGDKVAVAPVSMGWSDLGSWDALYDIGTQDAAGNVMSGDIIAQGAKGNLIRSDGLRISVAGVDDLIIIASGNDLLILPRGQSQAVKGLGAERTKA